MNLTEQIILLTDTIKKLKAEHITTLKIADQSSDMEAIIIATGRSTRHTRSVAKNVKMEAKRVGMQILGVEGLQLGEWVLVDLTEVIVHIMSEKSRNFYQLEKRWMQPNNRP